ncbi:temptin-like [Mytilus galloprovincialis]|uniref:temptin-like n=1 Tax=Mytilus galloprovincialis TaxID=29158 RepID=UPI003F7BA992
MFKMGPSCIILLFSVLYVILNVDCYPGFRNKIPNGNFVPCNCNNSNHAEMAWAAVGHFKLDEGTAQKNPFGIDFRKNGMRWTQSLCNRDSDGDGYSNGEELGDPNCTWIEGQNPDYEAIRHPGICEPIGSKFCIDLGQLFTCDCLEQGQFCPIKLDERN